MPIDNCGDNYRQYFFALYFFILFSAPGRGVKARALTSSKTPQFLYTISKRGEGRTNAAFRIYQHRFQKGPELMSLVLMHLYCAFTAPDLKIILLSPFMSSALPPMKLLFADASASALSLLPSSSMSESLRVEMSFFIPSRLN